MPKVCLRIEVLLKVRRFESEKTCEASPNLATFRDISEPEEDEMEKEEDDNVQVTFGQIELYQDESLAEDDSSGGGK